MASRPLSTDEFNEITMGRHQWLDMDPLTFSKIVQLRWEDIERLSSRSKGKQREGTVTDAQLAWQVYVDELADSIESSSDRMLAENIATNSLRDVSMIEQEAWEGQLDVEDGDYTSMMAGESPTQVNRRSLMQEMQRKDIDPLKELWPALVGSDTDSEESLFADGPSRALRPVLPDWASEESLVAAESSPFDAAQTIRDVRTKRRCIACAGEKLIRDLATVPCKHNHEYCRDCLSRLFQLSIDDESPFPAKCDGEVIQIDAYNAFLPQSLVDQYRSKALEYQTKGRAYCYESACADFIETPPPLPPRPPLNTIADTRIRRKPFNRANCRASVETPIPSMTASTNSMTTQPTIRFDQPSLRSRRPSLFAKRTQCAIQ